MLGRLLNAAERRTIRLATTALVGGVLLAYAVMPVARRWSAREQLIDAARGRVARLDGLARNQDALVAAAATRTQLPAAVTLLRARTSALVASQLQSALQQYARESRVSITRLDVASAPDSSATTAMIPASLSAVTDIYGLADLLQRLQHATMLVEVAEMSVTPNPGLRGDLLQVALVLKAPFLLEP